MNQCEATSLAGKMLIAMPGMVDDNFAGTTVLICAHSDEGAMGLITNRVAPNITFAKLVEHLELIDDGEPIEPPAEGEGRYDIDVQVGGPVDPSRGFVLHTPDYFSSGASVRIVDSVCLTATIEILRKMATGEGPDEALLALGYAAWSPGQLESEIQANGWLHTEANTGLIFETDLDERYKAAMTQLGIDPSFLVATGGTA